MNDLHLSNVLKLVEQASNDSHNGAVIAAAEKLWLSKVHPVKCSSGQSQPM